MKTLQHKNFSVARPRIEFNARLPGFFNGNPRYVVALNGKIKTAHVACPECVRGGSVAYVDNGYHAVEDSFVTALGLNIKIAQFKCKKCRHYWSTDRELIDHVILKGKEFVKSVLFGCVRAGLSFERACALVEETTGVRYSPQYLYELYVAMLDQVKQDKFASASGVYYYDEQYLKENGLEVCRLTIIDAVTGKVLLDRRAVDAQYDTIKHAVREALDGLPVEAFTVDMKKEYVGVINELYPKAKIQWCIFHLYKLIWAELQGEFGKNIPLVQLYNAYSLFNIFFNHEAELEELEELLKRLDQYKGKGSGGRESEQIERCLRQEFGAFVKELKKERRRKRERVPRRALEQSEKRIAQVKQQILLYPKKLQERVRKIEKDWDKFTLFQRDPRVQPTTNGVEHYFAATLAKTDKKDFRSKAAVVRELRACQAEWNGRRLFPMTTLLEVLGLVGLLFLAFPPL